MKRPRKMLRKTASATEAVTTAIKAMADADQRGAPLSLDARFPGGYVRVYVNYGTASAETSTGKIRQP